MKVFDCHSDIMSDITAKRLNGETDVLKNHHLEKLERGQVGGTIFALWTDPAYDPQEKFIDMLGASFDEFDKASDLMGIACNTHDIKAIQGSGKIAVVLGMEGLDCFRGNVSLLHMIYHLGFRHAMLTWNNDNEFATGALHEGPDDGLTELGKKALKEMESLGMVVDASHASEKTFWDICNNTVNPFIVSHSNVFKICPNSRNLKDEQIKAVAERGGLIGVNSWAGFIDKKKPSIQRLADHIDYIVRLVGIDYVGFGFDFCEYLGGNDDQSNRTPGLCNSGDVQNIISELFDRGYQTEEIEKLAYKNIFRVFDSVLKP